MATKRTFNQIITTGILARLRYEYTRHEGLLLDLAEETEPSGMEAFNIRGGIFAFGDAALVGDGNGDFLFIGV